MNRNRIDTAILLIAVISLLLLFTSLFLPWWGMKTHTREVTPEGLIHTEDDGLSFGLYGSSFLSLYDETLTAGIFRLTFLLILVPILSMGLLISYLLLCGPRSKKRLGVQLTLLAVAVVFASAAPLVFSLALPGAFKVDVENQSGPLGIEEYDAIDDFPTESFFGDVYLVSDESSIRVSWGGDTGWFIPFAAALLCSVCIVLVIVDARLERRGPDAPYSPDAGEDPYPFDERPYQGPNSSREAEHAGIRPGRSGASSKEHREHPPPPPRSSNSTGHRRKGRGTNKRGPRNQAPEWDDNGSDEWEEWH